MINIFCRLIPYYIFNSQGIDEFSWGIFHTRQCKKSRKQLLFKLENSYEVSYFNKYFDKIISIYPINKLTREEHTPRKQNKISPRADIFATNLLGPSESKQLIRIRILTAFVTLAQSFLFSLLTINS